MKIILIAVTVVMFLYNIAAAAVSDSFWNNAATIIGAITLLVTAVFTGAYKLVVYLKDLKKVTEDTHTLVNSNMGIQLKLNAGNARRVANFTKSAVDIEAAVEAEKLLTDHIAQQSIVDAGEKTE